MENIRMHGVPAVVAINAFPTDHPSEWRTIEDVAGAMNVPSAVCHHVTQGGAGATDLARLVAAVAEQPSQFGLLYPDDASPAEKIETVARRVYGARDVSYSPVARRQLDTISRIGWGRLPVCIAKTHLSLSDDPALLGAPTGWTLPVREVRAAVGAGFIYAICGEMRIMPGLGADPAAHSIDLNEDGSVVGLY